MGNSTQERGQQHMAYGQLMSQGLMGTVGLNGTSDGWRPMESAPRDGTVIEIRCAYGVAPWYGLFSWKKEFTYTQGDLTFTSQENPRWAKVGDDNSGFSEDGTFSWRPYTGNQGAYVDPTGGFQNDPRYWRQAAAIKHGLPANYFEKAADEPKSIWRRIAAFFTPPL